MMFLILSIICIFFTTNANGRAVGIEGANPNFNYDLNCVHYEDCHNCTVARCAWNSGNNKCEAYKGYSDDNKYELQVDDFFKYGDTCSDTLRLCERENNQDTLQSKLSFFNTWTTLPINYFCMWNLQGEDDEVYNERDSFSITSGRTVYTKNKIALDNAFAMWDNTCNFKSDSDCEAQGYMNTDEIEHMEVFNVTNVKNLKIGFINIFRLNKYKDHPDADEDHFELLVTSLKEKALFNDHDGAT